MAGFSRFRQFIDEYIDEHIKRVFDKTSRSIGLVCKLRNFPSFVGPHVDYGDIISDKSFTGFFQKKLESIYYNPALAKTGAIRGTSREKILSQVQNHYKVNVGAENYEFFVK